MCDLTDDCTETKGLVRRLVDLEDSGFPEPETEEWLEAVNKLPEELREHMRICTTLVCKGIPGL